MTVLSTPGGLGAAVSGGVHAAEPTPDEQTQAFHKTHLIGSRADLRVPMREVELTTGDRVVLYDTSGPYTDASITTDITRGLEPLREQWILERGDTVAYRGRV